MENHLSGPFKLPELNLLLEDIVEAAKLAGGIEIREVQLVSAILYALAGVIHQGPEAITELAEIVCECSKRQLEKLRRQSDQAPTT